MFCQIKLLLNCYASCTKDKNNKELLCYEFKRFAAVIKVLNSNFRKPLGKCIENIPTEHKCTFVLAIHNFHVTLCLDVNNLLRATFRVGKGQVLEWNMNCHIIGSKVQQALFDS